MKISKHIKSDFARCLDDLFQSKAIFKSKTEWSDYLSVSEMAISNWVTDKNAPRPEKLNLIIDLFLEDRFISKDARNKFKSLQKLFNKPLNQITPISSKFKESSTLAQYLLKPKMNAYLVELSGLPDSLKKVTIFFGTDLCRTLSNCLVQKRYTEGKLIEILNAFSIDQILFTDSISKNNELLIKEGKDMKIKIDSISIEKDRRCKMREMTTGLSSNYSNLEIIRMADLTGWDEWAVTSLPSLYFEPRKGLKIMWNIMFDIVKGSGCNLPVLKSFCNGELILISDTEEVIEDLFHDLFSFIDDQRNSFPYFSEHSLEKTISHQTIPDWLDNNNIREIDSARNTVEENLVKTAMELAS